MFLDKKKWKQLYTVLLCLLSYPSIAFLLNSNFYNTFYKLTLFKIQIFLNPSSTAIIIPHLLLLLHTLLLTVYLSLTLFYFIYSLFPRIYSKSKLDPEKSSPKNLNPKIPPPPFVKISSPR